MKAIHFIPFAFVVALLAAGCGPTPPQPSAAPPSPPPSPVGTAPTHGEVPAVDRTAIMIDMSEIAKWYENEEAAGEGAKDQVLKDIQREDRPLHQKIQAGLYVLLRGDPARAGDAILAYEKDAPAQGGVVLVGFTPRTMTAQEFQAAPKAGQP